MSNQLTDFLILRELDSPVTEAELDDPVDASAEALRDEGVGIEWVDSEVLANDEGGVTGTFCHYRAESERVIREHAERLDAGLPATRVSRRDEPLAGE